MTTNLCISRITRVIIIILCYYIIYYNNIINIMLVLLRFIIIFQFFWIFVKRKQQYILFIYHLYYFFFFMHRKTVHFLNGKKNNVVRKIERAGSQFNIMRAAKVFDIIRMQGTPAVVGLTKFLSANHSL